MSPPADPAPPRHAPMPVRFGADSTFLEIMLSSEKPLTRSALRLAERHKKRRRTLIATTLGLVAVLGIATPAVASTAIASAQAASVAAASDRALVGHAKAVVSDAKNVIEDVKKGDVTLTGTDTTIDTDPTEAAITRASLQGADDGRLPDDVADHLGKVSDQLRVKTADVRKALTDARAKAAAEAAAQAQRDAEAAAAKKAADEAAAAAAAQAQAAAAALAEANTTEGAKATARKIMSADYGWGDSEFSCLNSLWTKESGWNYQAENASSGAYGIPQSLPGSKMSTIAEDWAENAETQIKWGLKYIKNSYGNPCSAWGHSQATNWY